MIYTKDLTNEPKPTSNSAMVGAALLLILSATALAQSPSVAPIPKTPEHLFVRGHAGQRIWWHPAREFVAPHDLEWMSAALAAVNGLDVASISAVERADWKAQVLEAAQISVPWLWRINLGTASGLYTVTSTQGDVLVAQWRDLGSYKGRRVQESEVWLWDEPWETRFVIRVAREVVSDPKTFGRYCEDLFLWKDDLLRTLTLREVRTHDGHNWILGVFDRPTPSGVPTVSMQALTVGDKGFIVVNVPKPLADAGYPVGASRILERFPPLASRLRGYSKEALLRELGKGYPEHTLQYPEQRDMIIVSELVARERLTKSDVREVVNGRYGGLNWEDPAVVVTRARAFVTALKSRGQLPKYKSELVLALLESTIPARFSDEIAEYILSEFAKERVDASDGAVSLLSSGKCGYSCLNYLATEPSEAAIRQLSSINLSPELEAKKAVVILGIRRRMALGPPKRN